MSITPLRFTGVSVYSEEFQKILDRAVSIAALPIRQMQNQQADLISRKQTLTALRSGLESLQSAVERLGEVGASRALAVTSSNANRVTVAANGLVQPGGYTITEITSVARAASENTAGGYETPDATAVDGDGALELAFGASSFAITLPSEANHLNGLRDAINALGAGVTAAVVNTGSGPNPYYLSLTAAATGATVLQLRAEAANAGTNLLTADNQGANAEFKLNGLSLSRSDNVITDAIDGVTLTIVSKTEGSEAVAINASSSRGTLAGALGSLVNSYNNVRDQLNAQVGESAGLLSGDFVIRQARDALRSVSGYRGDGDMKSLAELGIELSKEGVMSFNATKFYAMSSDGLQDAFAFLGSKTTGLGSLTTALDQLADPLTGLIRTQQSKYDDSDKRLTNQITAMSARVELMQSSLSLRLQQADALLSALESQKSLIDSSIQSLNLSTFGKRDR